MYALLAILLQAAISLAAAMAIAPYSLDLAANDETLPALSLASTVISAIGLVSTSVYLSRRLRPVSGAMVGGFCGLLCAGILGLSARGVDYSLVLYLAILAPTLLAILLAALLDRPKSGWQT